MNDVFKPKNRIELSNDLNKMFKSKFLRLKLSLCPTPIQYLNNNFKFVIDAYDPEIKDFTDYDCTSYAKKAILELLRRMKGDIYVIEIPTKRPSDPNDKLLEFLAIFSNTITDKIETHLFWTEDPPYKPFPKIYQDDIFLYVEDNDKKIYFVSMDIFNIFKKYEIS